MVLLNCCIFQGALVNGMKKTTGSWMDVTLIYCILTAVFVHGMKKMSVLDGIWMDDICSFLHFLSIWMDDITRILHFLWGRLLMDEEDECIGWIIFWACCNFRGHDCCRMDEKEVTVRWKCKWSSRIFWQGTQIPSILPLRCCCFSVRAPDFSLLSSRLCMKDVALSILEYLGDLILQFWRSFFNRREWNSQFCKISFLSRVQFNEWKSMSVCGMAPGEIPWSFDLYFWNLSWCRSHHFLISEEKWSTNCRLLILFCLIDMLNYLDQEVIASNGVNGAPAAPGCLEHEACYSGSGIQYVTLLTNLVLEHLTYMQGLG